MTIASEVNKIDTFSGDGVTTSFSFSPMVIQDADQLEVTKIVSGVRTVLTRGSGGTNYSVTVSSYPGTGTITYPASGTTNILATGEKLVIKRQDELLQEVDLNNQGGYFPETFENALDLARIVDLQQQEELDRCMKMPIEEDISALDMTLPLLADRASMFLAFNAEGEPIAASSVATAVTISSFAETLLDDASAQAVLATLSPSGVMNLENTAADADGEDIVKINFIGRDDGATATTYVSLEPEISDNTDATEDGRLKVRLMVAGVADENVFQVGTGYSATLSSTDAGAVAGPDLVLDRNSASPADSDILGNVIFRGRDSGANSTSYARIEAVAEDVTDTTEDGYLQFAALRGGIEVKSLSPGILYTVQASTSGTSINFTGIPATARRITLMLMGVGTNSTASIRAQLGDSGGLETTGYTGGFGSVDDTTSNSGFITSGVTLRDPSIAAESISGQVIFTLADPATNTWVWSGCTMSDDTSDIAFFVAGSKAVSATLDRISVLSSDTFDEGKINILVE